jgi:hypothetical protein
VAKPVISSGATVTLGAPFFGGVGCGVIEGLAVGCGVSVGLGDGISPGVAVADGDSLGVGVGDLFLRFGLGDGVGEVFFRFGEAVGDGVGVDFLADFFRCFRVGVGVGVVVRNFLIFVPNDSSALLGATFIPKQVAAIRRLRRIILVAGNNQRASS